MFNERLKIAMEEANLSQADLAKLSGISKSSISQYLSGKFKAKPENLFILAKVLNKPASWLASEVDMDGKDKVLDPIASYSVNSTDKSKFYNDLSRLFSSDDFVHKAQGISKEFNQVNLKKLLKLIKNDMSVK